LSGGTSGHRHVREPSACAVTQYVSPPVNGQSRASHPTDVRNPVPTVHIGTAQRWDRTRQALETSANVRLRPRYPYICFSTSSDGRCRAPASSCRSISCHSISCHLSQGRKVHAPAHAILCCQPPAPVIAHTQPTNMEVPNMESCLSSNQADESCLRQGIPPGLPTEKPTWCVPTWCVDAEVCRCRGV